MIRYLLVIVLFANCLTLHSQDKMPYKLYGGNGKNATYAQLLKAASGTEVVLFGEQHDNAIVHWLQLELAKDISAVKPIIMGAEMIEADNQDQLNQYLNGKINQKALDTLARLWDNYKTDYKPLVDFAREHKYPFVATNIPRRYASLVYKQGFEALNKLTPEEKKWMAPLPLAYDANLPGYKNMIAISGGHGGDNLPKAQAVKDAAMAHFIVQNLKSGTVFIHYNGTYHSENYEGINWYLKKYRPTVKIVTIATVTQKEINTLENNYLNIADFIIVVDEDMTKTY